MKALAVRERPGWKPENAQRHESPNRLRWKNYAPEASYDGSSPASVTSEDSAEQPRIAVGISMSSTARLSASLLHSLYSGDPWGLRLQDFGLCFVDLPHRLGQNEALDAAVDTFLHSYQCMQRGEMIPRHSELVRYGNAIRLLREVMSTPEQATTPETTCAALLLYQYEVMKRQPATLSIITLAGGVSVILEAWGPTRVKSQFEYCLFMSHFRTIIIHCIVQGKSCFLDHPQWHRTMRKLSLHPTMIELWILLSRLPALHQQLRLLRLNEDDVPRRSKAVEAVEDFRQNVLLQREAMLAALAHPAVNSLVPAIYTGSRPALAVGDTDSLLIGHRIVRRSCIYNMCVVEATVLLRRLGIDDLMAEDDAAQAARNTIDTLDFGQSLSPVGALYWTTMGPVIYGISSDEDKQLIRDKVHMMVKPLNIGDFCHGYMQAVFDAMTGGPLISTE